jgi:YNFM family putative membrane transporter
MSTILVLCTLYAAQPIQPLFMSEFALTNFQAVIFTTVIMFPLGIAPILYGYILETVSTRKMLRFSLAALGVLEILFALGDSYAWLLAIRALQGLLIPAALTSIMTAISHSSSALNVQKALGYYVAITTLGGFLGRFFSGLLSEHFGWRLFFFIIGFALIAVVMSFGKSSGEGRAGFVKPTKKEIYNVLKIRHNLYIYTRRYFAYFLSSKRCSTSCRLSSKRPTPT